jgi:hypothetical protein
MLVMTTATCLLLQASDFLKDLFFRLCVPMIAHYRTPGLILRIPVTALFIYLNFGYGRFMLVMITATCLLLQAKIVWVKMQLVQTPNYKPQTQNYLDQHDLGLLLACTPRSSGSRCSWCGNQ